MLHTIVNNNACQSSLESLPDSFSIQVDQKVAKYSLRFWDWPKGHSALWKRPSNNTTCYCDILFTSISCYHRIQYSNSHPQATNIPARMTPIATNQARTPITSRAMCHNWRGTRERSKQEEYKTLPMVSSPTYKSRKKIEHNRDVCFNHVTSARLWIH